MFSLIRVAIKHFIYEKCINVFFNAIINNFGISDITEFKTGDEFLHIEVNVDLDSIITDNTPMDFKVRLFDCTILDTLEGTVLIEFFARVEEQGEVSKYEDWGEAVAWRVNSTDIIGYERIT